MAMAHEDGGDEATLLTVRDVVGRIVESVMDERGTIPVNKRTLELLKEKALLALGSVLQRISAAYQAPGVRETPRPLVRQTTVMSQYGDAIAGYFENLEAEDNDDDETEDGGSRRTDAGAHSHGDDNVFHPAAADVHQQQSLQPQAPHPTVDSMVGYFSAGGAPPVGGEGDSTATGTLEAASGILTLQNAAMGLAALLHVLYMLLDGNPTPERIAALLRAADDRSYSQTADVWDETPVADEEGRTLLARVRALFSRRPSTESDGSARLPSDGAVGATEHPVDAVEEAPHASSEAVTICPTYSAPALATVSIHDSVRSIIGPGPFASPNDVHVSSVHDASAAPTEPSTVAGSLGNLAEDESSGLLAHAGVLAHSEPSLSRAAPAHATAIPPRAAWKQPPPATASPPNPSPNTSGRNAQQPTMTYAEELERLISVVERLSRGRIDDQRSNTTLGMMGIRGAGAESPSFAMSQSNSSFVSSGSSSAVGGADGHGEAAPGGGTYVVGEGPAGRKEITIVMTGSPPGSPGTLRRGASRSLPSLIASSIRRRSSGGNTAATGGSSTRGIPPGSIAGTTAGGSDPSLYPQRNPSELSLASATSSVSGRRHSHQANASTRLLDKSGPTPQTSKQKLASMFSFVGNVGEKLSASTPALIGVGSRGGPGSAYVVPASGGAGGATSSYNLLGKGGSGAGEQAQPKRADLKALMPVIDRIMASPRLENQRVHLSDSQERVLAAAALVSLVERISRGRMEDQRQPCEKVNLSFSAPVSPTKTIGSSTASLFGVGKAGKKNVGSTRSAPGGTSSKSSRNEDTLEALFDVVAKASRPDPSLESQRYEVTWEKRREMELRKVEGIMDRMARGKMENQVWMDESARRLDDIETNIAPILERVSTRTTAMNDQQRYVVSKEKEKSMFAANVIGTINRSRMQNQDAEHPKDRELTRIMMAMEKASNNAEMDKQRYVPGKKSSKERNLTMDTALAVKSRSASPTRGAEIIAPPVAAVAADGGPSMEEIASASAMLSPSSSVAVATPASASVPAFVAAK